MNLLVPLAIGGMVAVILGVSAASKSEKKKKNGGPVIPLPPVGPVVAPKPPIVIDPNTLPMPVPGKVSPGIPNPAPPTPVGPPVSPLPLPVGPLPFVFGPPLNADGSYTVQAGDYGTLIARKIIGEPGRWRELLGVNPQIRSRPDPNDTGFVVYPGDVLTIPAEWLMIVNPLAGK